MQEGFTGMQPNTKMKDWDRDAADEEADVLDQIEDKEGSDSEDFEDW